jgi:tetratricopeptide (TPR) repeat protein
MRNFCLNSFVFLFALILFCANISAQDLSLSDMNVSEIEAVLEKISAQGINGKTRRRIENEADKLIEKNRLREARIAYEFLLKLDNSSRQEFLYNIKLGGIESEADNLRQALRYYDNARILYPSNIEERLKRGDALFKNNFFDLAQNEFQAALRMNKKSDYAKKRLGDIFLKRQLYLQALDYYKAISRNGFDRETFINMLLCYREMAMRLEALDLIGKNQRFFIGAYPHFLAGTIYMELKNYNKAKEEFLISSKAQPDNFAPYLYLATINVKEGNLSEAKDLLSTVLALNPDLAVADFMFAQLYYKEGDRLRAKQYAQNAVRKSQTKNPFIKEQAQKLIKLIDRR